jgi:hypothetical protein
LGGNLAVAVFLFFLTTFYCLKTLKFTSSTGEFINKFREKLVNDWEKINKKEDVTSDNQGGDGSVLQQSMDGK